MKYFYDFLDLGCFKRNDLEPIVKNKKTINSLLTRNMEGGFIKRVKHNYYVAMDIVNEVPLCNKYVIATKINEDNYISYHSAMEFYSYNNQVFNEVVFCGNKRVNDFSFDDISFHFVQSKCHLQIVESSDGIRVTSLERTIVDCIDCIDLAGGIEELYHALNSIHNIDESKLIEILDFYQKKILYQRAGYILETFKNNLNISESTLDYLNIKKDSSKCYLISSKKHSDTVLDRKWNVCVPPFISSILLKGGTAHAV